MRRSAASTDAARSVTVQRRPTRRGPPLTAAPESVGSPGGTPGRGCAAARRVARPSTCSTTGPGCGSPARAPAGSTTPETGPPTTACAATGHRRGRSWPASCDPATPRSRPDPPDAPPPPPRPARHHIAPSRAALQREFRLPGRAVLAQPAPQRLPRRRTDLAQVHQPVVIHVVECDLLSDARPSRLPSSLGPPQAPENH